MARIKLAVGSITKKHGAWHWRYYQNGKQRSEKLAVGACARADVIAEANERAQRMGVVSDQPRSGRESIVEFVDSVYLPWVKESKRPATHHGYKQIWETHLRSHFGERQLADYQPFHATEYLTSLVKAGKMGRYAISHVRAVMSGIFAHACARGYLKANPIRSSLLLASPAAPKETPHYTVAEMAAILEALDVEPMAQVAMALAFVGLRKAEIQGVRNEDMELGSGVLKVRRTVWRGKVGDGSVPTKKRSFRDVTLGPTVARIIERYRAEHPSRSGFLLENTAGKPLDLGLFSSRVIRPILKANKLEWKSYYAGRRGAETEMNRYTNGNSQTTAHHFGHSKEVADAHYIKPLPEETKRAALALDQAILEANKGHKGQQVM